MKTFNQGKTPKAQMFLILHMVIAIDYLVKYPYNISIPKLLNPIASCPLNVYQGDRQNR